MRLRNILLQIKNYLFPDFCALCGCSLIKTSDIKTALCENCENSIISVKGEICRICGKALISEKETCLSCRNGERKPYDRQYLLFPYTGNYRKLLHSYKFEKNTALAEFFAKRINELIIKNDELKDAAIVPVPARPQKIKEAGWDQVEYLVKLLKKRNNMKICNCLKRKKSKAQKQLNRTDRISNLKGRIYTHKVLPEKALIIDDVTTTGSTIEVCSGVLKDNGVKEVYALCLFYD